MDSKAPIREPKVWILNFCWNSSHTLVLMSTNKVVITKGDSLVRLRRANGNSRKVTQMACGSAGFGVRTEAIGTSIGFISTVATESRDICDIFLPLEMVPG